MERMFPISTTGRPGTWRPVRRDGVRTADIICPKCGLARPLDQFEIKADGTVHPSVECPQKSCDFHSWIKLGGWQ